VSINAVKARPVIALEGIILAVVGSKGKSRQIVSAIVRPGLSAMSR
jgi:hypothetical protein